MGTGQALHANRSRPVRRPLVLPLPNQQPLGWREADFHHPFRGWTILEAGIPIAVVAAKDNTHSVGDGMQQALAYSHADCLDVPFAISSNGDGFLIHDRTGTFSKTEFEVALDAFPSPEDLWQRYRQWPSPARILIRFSISPRRQYRSS